MEERERISGQDGKQAVDANDLVEDEGQGNELRARLKANQPKETLYDPIVSAVVLVILDCIARRDVARLVWSAEGWLPARQRASSIILPGGAESANIIL